MKTVMLIIATMLAGCVATLPNDKTEVTVYQATSRNPEGLTYDKVDRIPAQRTPRK